MNAEGDSPTDRGTVRNVGDITCPRQWKPGQKLIMAHANIATSVTQSQVKCRVLCSRQPDFCKLIKLCFKASCDYWPAMITALLTSLYFFFFFYYGQWRSFDFWERSTESLRQEATLCHLSKWRRSDYFQLLFYLNYGSLCTFTEGSVSYVNEIDDRKKPQQPQKATQNHKKRVWTAASVLCNMSSQIIFNKQVCPSKCTHAHSPPPLSATHLKTKPRVLTWSWPLLFPHSFLNLVQAPAPMGYFLSFSTQRTSKK